MDLEAQGSDARSSRGRSPPPPAGTAAARKQRKQTSHSLDHTRELSSPTSAGRPGTRRSRTKSAGGAARKGRSDSSLERDGRESLFSTASSTRHRSSRLGGFDGAASRPLVLLLEAGQRGGSGGGGRARMGWVERGALVAAAANPASPFARTAAEETARKFTTYEDELNQRIVKTQPRQLIVVSTATPRPRLAN